MWWIAILFAIGSTCFLVGPFPGYAALVGAEADALTFFVGSIFFTTAALLQCLETWSAPADRSLEQHHPVRRHDRLQRDDPPRRPGELRRLVVRPPGVDAGRGRLHLLPRLRRDGVRRRRPRADRARRAGATGSGRSPPSTSWAASPSASRRSRRTWCPTTAARSTSPPPTSRRRSAASASSSARCCCYPSTTAGAMLALRRKRLPGSKRRLTSRSRGRFGPYASPSAVGLGAERVDVDAVAVGAQGEADVARPRRVAVGRGGVAGGQPGAHAPRQVRGRAVRVRRGLRRDARHRAAEGRQQDVRERAGRVAHGVDQRRRSTPSDRSSSCTLVFT